MGYGRFPGNGHLKRFSMPEKFNTRAEPYIKLKMKTLCWVTFFVIVELKPNDPGALKCQEMKFLTVDRQNIRYNPKTNKTDGAFS